MNAAIPSAIDASGPLTYRWTNIEQKQPPRPVAVAYERVALSCSRLFNRISKRELRVIRHQVLRCYSNIKFGKFYYLKTPEGVIKNFMCVLLAEAFLLLKKNCNSKHWPRLVNNLIFLWYSYILYNKQMQLQFVYPFNESSNGNSSWAKFRPKYIAALKSLWMILWIQRIK